VSTKLKLKRGFAAHAERTAELLRSQLGLQAHDPLCAFRLCEHLRIEIFVSEQVHELSTENLTILNHSKAGWSAATFAFQASHGPSHLIIHNKTHSPARQQSNIMHELGHILCEHGISALDVDMGFPALMRHYPEEQELEAECMGATLQLPRPALLRALESGWDKQAIVQHYQASASMVQLRINKTGVKHQLANRW
jgi:Zn-dependent peptidase ImmA (M78 family)